MVKMTPAKHQHASIITVSMLAILKLAFSSKHRCTRVQSHGATTWHSYVLLILNSRHLKKKEQEQMDNTQVCSYTTNSRNMSYCEVGRLLSQRKSWWKPLSAIINNVLFNFMSQQPLRLHVRSTRVSLFRKSWHL